MNIETLQYFQYIAKYKNITKAAKHFYISQSTLSRHIMALENELGVKLLERSNKQVELTKAGEILNDNCASFINHMSTIIKNIQAADRGNSGILRITSPSTLIPLLHDALDLIQENYPAIRLSVESYDFDEIPNAIKYDLYDIGLTYDFASSNYEDLQSTPVGTDDFSLVVSSRLFPVLTEEAIATVINSLPLILPSHVEPPFFKLLLHHLQSFSGAAELNPTYVNTTESVMLETHLGLGYGIVPTSWIKFNPYNETTSSATFDSFTTQCDIVMLYKTENATKLTTNFVNIVKGLYQMKKTVN